MLLWKLVCHVGVEYWIADAHAARHMTLRAMDRSATTFDGTHRMSRGCPRFRARWQAARYGASWDFYLRILAAFVFTNAATASMIRVSPASHRAHVRTET